jgi:hypothetical protein
LALHTPVLTVLTIKLLKVAMIVATSKYAGGETADAWTVGAKYDANNVYLAAMYAETRNMTAYGDDKGGIANKTQNFKLLHNTSLTLVCARPLHSCNLKVST